MPVVLPHKLVPFLIREGVILESPQMDEEVDQYWRFLASRGYPGAADQVGSGCIPLWLWGDDCQYNKQLQKIVTITCGCVLDPRSCPKDMFFPLVVCQVDAGFANVALSSGVVGPSAVCPGSLIGLQDLEHLP